MDTTVNTGWNDIGKLILRCTVAALMLFHGIAKMKNGIGWMAGMLSEHHLPFALGYGVYVAEVLAPILLIVGLFTRLAALTIVFDMFMAVVLTKMAKLFTVNMGGGWVAETEAFYALAALAVFFLGAGRFSVRGGSGRWD
jgi:putative oxidoreductase